jgi:hypothetical protein
MQQRPRKNTRKNNLKTYSDIFAFSPSIPGRKNEKHNKKVHAVCMNLCWMMITQMF